MENIIVDLYNTREDIDLFLEKFRSIIYDYNGRGPAISFDQFISSYYHAYRIHILDIIVNHSRLDIIINLYENNIQVHKRFLFNHIILHIIENNNIEFMDCFIDNGYHPMMEPDGFVCSRLFHEKESPKYHDIILHLIDKLNNDKESIIIILKRSIVTHKYDFIKIILDQIDSYGIIDLDSVVCDAFKNFPETIEPNIIEYLCSYGFNFDLNKEKLLFNIFNGTGSIHSIKYLLSCGIDLNHQIFNHDQ